MPVKKRTTPTWHEAIASFIEARDSAIAVVPNQKWSNEINRRLTIAQRPAAILGKFVFTVNEYADEFNLNAPIINRPLQRHLVRGIIKAVPLAYFKSVSEGVLNAFMSAMTNLKKNGIYPDGLEQILTTRGGLPESDLLKVYLAYENEISKRGWYDHENKFNNLACGKTVYLIGFDKCLPWMENVFSKAVFFDVVPQDIKPPQVIALNSNLAEARFAEQSILNFSADGKRTAVYLEGGDTFIWKILDKEDFLPFDPGISNIARGIFNNAKLPDEAVPAEYIEQALGLVESGMPNDNASPAMVARTASYADHITKILKRMLFEHNILKNTAPVTKGDFLSILHDEFKSDPAWPENLTFQPVEWNDAGLYEHDTAILPKLNSDYIPPQQRTVFFSEPDTLRPAPDGRIEAIFLRQEEVIKTYIKHLRLVCASETVATYHIYTETGRDASPSPLILKYQHTFSPPLQVRSEKVSQTCGTNLTGNFAQEHVFSATQLEKYGNCPFAYFCEYMLEIKPPEDITPDIQARDRGTLIHDSLEYFFKTHGAEFNAAIDGRDKGFKGEATDAVNRVFTERNDITKKYHPDIVAHFKRRTTHLIFDILVAELEFLRKTTQRPSHFEVGFKEMLEDIKITGRIDRIDTDDTTFSVIDYKSGSTESVINNIRNGLELQAPIYTEMARRLLKKEPAAFFLYSTKSKKRTTGIIRKDLHERAAGKEHPRLNVSPEEWDELMDLGIKTAVGYAEGIRNGRFEKRPHKCENYCDWKDVCRFK